MYVEKNFSNYITDFEEAKSSKIYKRSQYHPLDT